MSEILNTDIKELNEKINKESAIIDIIMLEMNKVIVGQKNMTERLMIALLENNQNEDGSVNIPPVLRKYMNNQDKI